MVITLSVICLIGYLLIILEDKIEQDKSSISLIIGSTLWILIALFSEDKDTVSEGLSHHIEEIASIIFFLMGAMTIVEIIEINDGFSYILKKIKFNDKKMIVISIAVLSFFLSSFLDNLTTAIVMASMSSKLFSDKIDKMYAAGIIIICANAGGAWSPLGDVTTTMLWISGRISEVVVVSKLIIPSLVCSIIPVAILIFNFKGKMQLNTKELFESDENDIKSNILLFVGVSGLMMVPVIKILTGLPPFIGMILAVGVLWVVSEVLNILKPSPANQDRTIYKALEKIDLPSILFFLGILLAVAALQQSDVLALLANWCSDNITNNNLFLIIIGIFSSIFDNVPILAAIQNMYTLDMYPKDSNFWILLAYTVGTGGSMLVIGSAAGVAIMNSQGLTFGWYLKKITIPAFIGFITGALTFVFMF